MPRSVVVNAGASGYVQNISVGPHLLQADEPSDYGGHDAGPNPYELLLAALGACTSITVRMYAARKQWPLHGVQVRLTHSRIHAEDCAECETKEGMLDRIETEISFIGDLSEARVTGNFRSVACIYGRRSLVKERLHQKDFCQAQGIVSETKSIELRPSSSPPKENYLGHIELTPLWHAEVELSAR